MDKYYRLYAGYRGQPNDSEKHGYSEVIYQYRQSATSIGATAPHGRV